MLDLTTAALNSLDIHIQWTIGIGVYVVGPSQISFFLCTLEEDMYTAMLDLTTAALNSLAIHIQWTLLNVAKFPEVQTKCREEIKRVSLKNKNIVKDKEKVRQMSKQ